jgi:hypothetical protein
VSALLIGRCCRSRREIGVVKGNPTGKGPTNSERCPTDLTLSLRLLCSSVTIGCLGTHVGLLEYFLISAENSVTLRTTTIAADYPEWFDRLWARGLRGVVDAIASMPIIERFNERSR